MTSKLVHDKAEVVDVIDESDDQMTVRLAAAKEIVQNYGDYTAYKSAEALDKASFTAEGAYITFTHPSDNGVVTNQEEIIGFAGSPSFSDEDSTLFVEAELDKSRSKPKTIEGIKEGKITDVSIGFYTDEIPESGNFNGKQYDVKQKNIVIDHVAILPEDSKGRCSSEDGCGIVENIDRSQADDLEFDQGVADIAFNKAGALDAAKESLESQGFEVEARECNCGDHHGHLEVDGIQRDVFVPSHRALGDYSTTNGPNWDGLSLSDFATAYGWDAEQVSDLSNEQKAEMASHYGIVDAETSADIDSMEDLAFEHHTPSDDGSVHRGAIDSARQLLPNSDYSRDKLERLDRHLVRHLREDFSEQNVETVFDWEAVDREFGQDNEFPEDKRQDFIRQASEDINRPMSKDNIEDYDLDELKDHSEVQKLVDKASEAQDRVEELEDKLEDMREDKAQELRTELVDEFGVEEDAVEDKDLDTLEDLKDTLEASELSAEDEDDGDEDDSEADGSTVHTSGATSDSDDEKPSALMPKSDGRRRVSRE